MKKVKLEDVTGEKAKKRPAPVREQAAAFEPDIIGRPKTIEEQMDKAAGKVAWAVMACFFLAAYLLVNAVWVSASGDTVYPPFFVAVALVELACGWLIMQYRSRVAAITAVSVYGPFAVLMVVESLFSGKVLMLVIFACALGAMGNGVSAILAYHRLAKEADEMDMSDAHIKDVLGTGQETKGAKT